MVEQKMALVKISNLAREWGYFHLPSIVIRPGDWCVVYYEGWLMLGRMERIIKVEKTTRYQRDRIIRAAKVEDIETMETNRNATKTTLAHAQQIASSSDLLMDLFTAEFALDRSRLRIYFTASQRIDFRDLLKTLSKTLGVRVELRQVGLRDKTRIIGAIGHCGRVVCCRDFLREPQSIPIEMAHDQELFVSPERLTGVCGRLMCCLAFEHEIYKEELGKMPPLNSCVCHKNRRCKVIAHNIFRKTVTIVTDKKERINVPCGEISYEKPPATHKRSRRSRKKRS